MKNTTIKKVVFDSILDDIINGVYPMDHVFNEKALIEKYNVSKSPVRDALIELCNENVLYSIPRYGYKIVRLTERNIREITKLRVLIEVAEFKKNCKKYAPVMLAFIKEHNAGIDEIQESAGSNIQNRWKNNVSYHLSLYSFADNQYVSDVLNCSLNVLYRAYSQLYWKKSRTPGVFDRRVNEYHDLMEAAMEAGEYDKAAEALELDIEDISTYGGD